MLISPDNPIKRVIIIVQENHTVDNYFRGLAPYGAAVATDWPLSPNPPARDQPHDRHAYYDWLTGLGTAAHVQFDTASVLPYYLYLAVTGAFLENHCAGFGTNSTPNHLLVVGGQSPTLKNPSRRQPPPLWDMPSVPGLADDNGLAWRAYAASGQYPVGFYQQLQSSPNVVSSSAFIRDAQAGPLPSLVYLWHNSPYDEHPTADVSVGMNIVWQSVDAVVQSGGWAETVFMLTWDDWGGFDDHVTTPVIEYTPDNVQLAYGPRVPLLMFGGHVKPGIDSRWCGHASIAKTAIQLLGLPALGVPRVDDDPGLADLVDPAMTPNPPPPAFGSQVQTPPPPSPPRQPNPPPPPPVASPAPVASIVLRDGTTLPPPNDAPLPQQPNPPANAPADPPAAPAPAPAPTPTPAPTPAPASQSGSWKVVLTDQSSAGVPAATLQQIAAALQQQVDNDFAPQWGVRADISALDSGTPIPPGAWPIKIIDNLPGAGGVHLDQNGQPYAEAVNGPELSIAISHELLEMLVDPWGNRFTPGPDLDPQSDGHQVFYLVEVGDPCEVSSYEINGVAVSDFILPSFYDPAATGQVDFRHTLAGPLPRAVPPGCYISWIDPQDGRWHQQQTNGTIVTAAVTPSRNPRDDRDKVLGDTDPGRHNIAAIYRDWVT